MVTPDSFLNAQGQTYHDFVVRKCIPLPELNATLRELEHLPSGAEVMHIDCDDPENLFCLSLKTYPTSSNGAPHILEHTVLCGSKKFPVKDPFFAMGKRSLNTFMNALTGTDFTCYPAASQNEQDFYNLLDVYLDAVFHPELKKMSFLQEGHRLEFINPKDPKSPLQIKGVVYNEMKGAMTSIDSRLWHTLLSELTPDLPYAYNAGGDPKVIPHLSYEELLKFHSTYYHPSHCLFFFYGNFSLKKHLDTLAKTLLDHAHRKTPFPLLPRQKRFTTPKSVELPYPVSADEDESPYSVVSIAFLTTPIVEQETLLALSLLDIILMDNDASILRAELLKSGLCVGVDGYIDMEMSEVPYAFVFKGCDADNVEKIEKHLFQSLHHITLTGIPEEAVKSALHQLEFSRLEITENHSPFGLTLFMRAALAKQHGCPAENALMLYSLFKKLNHDLQDPKYLIRLIQQHFLNNPHRVTLLMRPDTELSSKEVDQERETLSQLKQQLSPQEIKNILRETKELEKFQEQAEEQSLDCLPKIQLSDISPEISTFPLHSTSSNALSIHHHPCFTNHICYADLFFDLPHIDAADLPYVSLLLSLLPSLGCGGRTFSQNLQFIQSHIGGISLSAPLCLQVQSPNQVKPAIHLRAKALDRHLPQMFQLMKETLLSTRLDETKRIEELIKKMREGLRYQINKKAIRYAALTAFSGASDAGYIQESWYGLTYYHFIETLTKDLSANLPALIDKLITLKDSLFSYHNPTLVLSCSQSTYDTISSSHYFGLTELCPKAPFHDWNTPYALPSITSHMRPISSPVAFTIQGFKTVNYLHKHSPFLTIASALCEHLVLHKEVREQGGAYGCNASYSTLSGQFHFDAYRDPHIASTLSSFEKAITTIAMGQFSDQDLEEAKISLLQHIDSPISPSIRALTAYTWLREGKTTAMRHHFRSQLLAATRQDVQSAVAQTLLTTQKEGIIISFAGKELLEEENQKLKARGAPLPIVPL